jgi:lipoprotein-anchoring transpeptidase ErfK/SrfK
VSERRILIDLGRQRLELREGERVLGSWPVSTAAAGAGERDGSECTPRGRHAVHARIGDGQPEGAVFVGRRPTGEVCTPEAVRAEPGRDWILTRILWLEGLEPGRNRGAGVDTRERHVYVHGTPDEASLGTPASHGCIRMRNADVVALFDQVEVGTPVEIFDTGDVR